MESKKKFKIEFEKNQ